MNEISGLAHKTKVRHHRRHMKEKRDILLTVTEQTVLRTLQEAAFDNSKWVEAIANFSQIVDGAGTVLFSTSDRLALHYTSELAETLHTYSSDLWNLGNYALDKQAIKSQSQGIERALLCPSI